MQGEHSSQSVHSQGQTQPQPGQVSFSVEIKVSVSNILGLIVIRFGIIQIRKYKKGEIRSKNNIFSQISFLIFFAAIIGLVIYSILGLLE